MIKLTNGLIIGFFYSAMIVTNGWMTEFFYSAIIVTNGCDWIL